MTYEDLLDKVASGGAEAEHAWREQCSEVRNREACFNALCAKGLAERRTSSVTGSEYHFKNPDAPAVKIWLETEPPRKPRQRRTT
jgi:hypothetical protein